LDKRDVRRDVMHKATKNTA